MLGRKFSTFGRRFYPLHRHTLREYSKAPHFQPYKIDRDSFNEIQHQVDALRRRNPLALEVLHRIDIEGMSLGSISPLTHGHIAQTVMALAGVRTHAELVEKYYATDHLITSNSGEGGDINQHLAKQIASARFGVNLDYITDAAIIQFKAAQGVKPGVGGALSGLKVNALIAQLRNCEPGTDLYSPGPHADQYSIEDLRLLLKGYLLANPRLVTSVKLASEPGVDTIALGCVKAMGLSEQGRRNNIVITGKGSTGNTPLFTKYHTTFPWLVGLAKTHAKLVQSGLRDNITLTASGGFVGSFMAPFLWGADRIGIATMALVGGGCIMVRKCHDNTCPTGVATQDPILIAKNTGSPLSIARILLAAAELTAIELQPYFDHVSQAVGRAPDILEPALDGPLIGHESYLKLLKQKPRFISLGRLPLQTGPSYQENEVIEAVRTTSQTDFHVQSDNSEIAFGTRLGALTKTDTEMRAAVKDKTIHLQMTGFTGQNLAILGAENITYDAKAIHTNDSTAKSLSGAEVFAKTCGNQAGFAMTNGFVATRGVGSRGAVRKSGGTFITESAGAFFANFHTRGNTYLLGHPEHYEGLTLEQAYQPPFAFKKNALDFGFLSGFSGGSVFLPKRLWEEALKMNLVSPAIRDHVRAVPLTDKDCEELLATLEKSAANLDSVLQKSLLAALKANPPLMHRWFIKLLPPPSKRLNTTIGQIALAEEKLPPPTVSRSVEASSSTTSTPPANNPNMITPPGRDHAACGTSLVMQLDGHASHEIVALGIQALQRSEHRGAGGVDPLSGDGCGIMLYFGAGFFERLPEFHALDLKPQQFAVMTIFMPKNENDHLSAEALLQRALNTFDLNPAHKRIVPIDNSKLGIQAKADELVLVQYVIPVSATESNLAAFDRKLSLAHLNFEFNAQQMPMPHKPHICSASRRFTTYKTKGKEKHIADIYPDLKNPQLTASLTLAHARFATNTDTLIESVQPLAKALFNGEVNNLRRFIEEIKYHPHFSKLIEVDFNKLDLSRYSDSAIMSYYMMMLQLLGYDSQQIHDAIFHPYDPTKKNTVAEFHDLVGIPGLEGPNGSIRVYEHGDEVKVTIETDSMGWRPHRGIIDKNRRLLVTGSEHGIVTHLQGDAIEMGPGEAFEINLTTGRYTTLKQTAKNSALFAEKLALIRLVKPSDHYEYSPLPELTPTELRDRKLRANITPEIEETFLLPMFNQGNGFTVSMGDDGGDEVTVSGPTRFVNTLKTSFAQITRPPLDYQREGEVMSGATFIGSKALPDEIYTAAWTGVRVDNPVIDNDQMHMIATASNLRTTTLDCTYPVRGRDPAMLAALDRVSQACIKAAQDGSNLIILSDIHTNATHAPLLPAILTGAVDLALRKSGLRHKVSLCLQSSICVTPLEQIAAISLGANIINPYLIFIPDQHYAKDKTTFIRQRKSYLDIALKEILAAAARAGVRTISSGYQGTRLITALGVDNEVADRLGIYSELGGFDWANIAASAVDMHTRPGNYGKYIFSGQPARMGKWNPGLVSIWRSIAKGEKTLGEAFTELTQNIQRAEQDNIEGWFRKKPPMIWTAENPMTIIIVGGGAAGFMQAQALLNSSMANKIRIKIIEENPANLFGMVKDAIAPDKQATRETQFKLLSQCLEDKRVEYYGGVIVDENHLSFEQLLKEYPCVIDCRGAPSDKMATEIEGHDLLIPASKVWKAYNGFFDPLNPQRYWPFREYSRSQVKIVIGNGNVAADIIRLLLTDPDSVNATEMHPIFQDRLRKKGPSFIRNVARGSVTQCKITLKELESFEKNGIRVRASFDEKDIDESSLSQEQLAKLAFFRNAKNNNTSVALEEACVHFHFGCVPKKIYHAGRNILEMEVVHDDGSTEQFRGGDFISAIGRNAPEKKSATPFVTGWASGMGGNLATIQESVVITTAQILAKDEQRGFDHTTIPTPERQWQREASVTNQGFLNILAYYRSGQPLNTIEDWRKARDYHPAATTLEKQQPATQRAVAAGSGNPVFAVISPKTGQPIPVPLPTKNTSIYRLLKEAAAKNSEIPVPDNECSEAGTCIRCTAESNTPVIQKPLEKTQLTAVYGNKKSATLFLTCQRDTDSIVSNQPTITIQHPVKNK